MESTIKSDKYMQSFKGIVKKSLRLIKNHTYEFSVWNVIDPQNQIYMTFKTEDIALEYLEKLDVPYKEFWTVQEQKVHG